MGTRNSSANVRWTELPAPQLQESRLAGTIEPDHRDDRTGLEAEVDVPQRPVCAEAFADASQFNIHADSVGAV